MLVAPRSSQFLLGPLPPRPKGYSNTSRGSPRSSWEPGGRRGKAETCVRAPRSPARIETLENRGNGSLGGRQFLPGSSSPSASRAEPSWEYPRAECWRLLSREHGEAGVVCLSELVINSCSQEGMQSHFLGNAVCWQETKRQKCQIFQHLGSTQTPSQTQALPSHPQRHWESTWGVGGHCQHSGLPKLEVTFSRGRTFSLFKGGHHNQQGNRSPCSFRNSCTYKQTCPRTDCQINK